MTFEKVMHQLESFGNDSTRRIYKNHGAPEPLFGVKIADLKKILKETKNDHELAQQLYATGNSDAMYLAGLMADKNKITKEQLQSWIKKASWYMISEYSVAALAAETPFALELAREWIKSDLEHIAAAGWTTYSGYISLHEESQLDLTEIANLLNSISDTIHNAQNRVRYAMNNFVISAGGYIGSMKEKALAISQKIGKVRVDMGGTACKVPFAPDYIEKMVAKGSLKKKRKAVRC